MASIICRSCGELFNNRRELISHVLKLDCFNENLEWKKDPQLLKEILERHDNE